MINIFNLLKYTNFNIFELKLKRLVNLLASQPWNEWEPLEISQFLDTLNGFIYMEVELFYNLPLSFFAY
jgi:hypothetical protein